MNPYALRPWYRVHASSIALAILALIFFLLAGCTTTPPEPVAIAPVSLAGIERPVRVAVAANAKVLTHAQRQKVLLAEAEAILGRYPRTFAK